MSTREHLVEISLFALVLLLYLSTLPTAAYNSDVYDFIGSVRLGDPKGLFHVHHLLFNALGWIWSHGWRALGLDLDLDVLLRCLNAALGAATVACFHRLLHRFLPAALDRFLASVLLATTFSIWMFSVDFEVYIASTLFLAAALALLWRRPVVSPHTAVLAGGLLAASALFHQMGALFSLVVVAVVALSDAPLRTRVSAVVTCLGTGAILTLVPYLAVGVAWHEVRSLRDLAIWILGYSLRGYGEGLHPAGLAMAVVGQGRSLVFFGHVLQALQESSPWRLPGLLLVALTGLVFAAGCWGALAGWWRLPGGRRYWLPLGVWYLVYALFALWWEPENPEFWVTATLPFVALWGGGLALAGGRWRWLVALAAAIALFSNLADIGARSDPDYDPDVRAVREIARRVGSDAVIAPPSFTARAALFAPDTRWINLYHLLQDAEPSSEAALAALLQRVEEERAAGRRVFLYAEAVNDRMRSLFPHADAALEGLARSETLVPAFQVVMPYDPSGEFGAFARAEPVAVLELVRSRTSEPTVAREPPLEP